MLPRSFREAANVLGIAQPGAPLGFRFRRRRPGTEIWLLFRGGLSLNLSCDHGYQPNFTEARSWARAFADAHRFQFREITRSAG